jgi:hypothetical protein
MRCSRKFNIQQQYALPTLCILYVFCVCLRKNSDLCQWRTQKFFSPPQNSVDRGQREQGSGGGSPLVRGSAQFENG